jgi:hypothetical protein
MDDWYVDCKLLLFGEDKHFARAGKNNFGLLPASRKSMNKSTESMFRRRLGSIAHTVVSFHYVSPVESKLLYELLAGEQLLLFVPHGVVADIPSSIPEHDGRRREKEGQLPIIPISSAAALNALWPRGNLSIVGDYARSLASLDEASMLLDFLRIVKTKLQLIKRNNDSNL